MKSVYLQSPNDIKIKEVEAPVRKENEALIKIKAVGICGSDVASI